MDVKVAGGSDSLQVDNSNLVGFAKKSPLWRFFLGISAVKHFVTLRLLTRDFRRDSGLKKTY
jgi:hypothetical protein